MEFMRLPHITHSDLSSNIHTQYTTYDTRPQAAINNGQGLMTPDSGFEAMSFDLFATQRQPPVPPQYRTVHAESSLDSHQPLAMPEGSHEHCRTAFIGAPAVASGTEHYGPLLRPYTSPPSVERYPPPACDEYHSTIYPLHSRTLSTPLSASSQSSPQQSFQEVVLQNYETTKYSRKDSILSRGRQRQRMPHTTIERRYRENLRAQIQNLRDVIPLLRNASNTGSRDGQDHADLRQPSKCTILMCAVEYIAQLEAENAQLLEVLKMSQ
jgi:hypothetical protein